ncbi:glycine betaine ABC transporter substrate-binding protein [Streptomyces boncukensis]|uniref:Glycine/betaine ABC transporter substrate-binding protein n=1 Tax=Streptomyces boncukensis TaxID=2711219 RepID=A0A6G4WXT8_9ACTN|nr:glycine betaine ABC transporter substrate-binding protein [Streptomyces boncukensis]NGO69261.1 glycine/betaine ABC transporter substrate-binding protein [Streptomyces boncukensis]
MKKRILHTAAAVTGVTAMLTISACAADTDKGSGDGKEVTIAQPAWAGAEANVAVAKKLLEDELDVKVKVQQMDEAKAFQAANDNDVQAILEDWDGNPKEVKRYVDDKKTVVGAGTIGVQGHIGWYVPTYYAKQHPEVKTWEGLNKLWKDFKTTESKGKGQFMGAAPGYSQHDTGIIKNLNLNFTHVPSGTEDAQQAEIKRLYKQKKPFVTYWWTPQLLQNELDLTEVKLPKFTDGCNEPVSKAKCGYPTLDLKKFLNKEFADGGSDAAKFLKKMKWTTADQDKVVTYMKVDKMKPDAAAEKWVKENKSTWEKWVK